MFTFSCSFILKLLNWKLTTRDLSFPVACDDRQSKCHRGRSMVRVLMLRKFNWSLNCYDIATWRFSTRQQESLIDCVRRTLVCRAWSQGPVNIRSTDLNAQQTKVRRTPRLWGPLVTELRVTVCSRKGSVVAWQKNIDFASRRTERAWLGGYSGQEFQVFNGM